MKRPFIQSQLLRWLLRAGILWLLVMTAFRLIFIIKFKPGSLSFGSTAPAFMMGLRYDARIVSIFLLFLFLTGMFRIYNPFRTSVSKKAYFILIGLFTLALALFYAIDFSYYSYLSQRLNAQVLNFLDDPNISFNMVMQSYPVIWILAGILAYTALLLFVMIRWHKRISKQMGETRSPNKFAEPVVFILLLLVISWGRVGQFPLRWGDAFRLRNDFEANAALNPFQSFFSTLAFRGSGFNLQKTKQYYSLMAGQLGVENKDEAHLNFERIFPARHGASKPNIVLVICESFSAYKSSMWGNPLNTTPFFKQLCDSGAFFNRCFTPSWGTARGVWATITGIPDVEMQKTASRNPGMVDQSTIMNDFAGYEKMYFIGGSASWANIRGVLLDNIEGLHLHEEQDYHAKREDVWGISDKNLMLEANAMLAKQSRPFFAIIQTAGNHRPYSIPNEDRNEFKDASFPPDTLKKYGFDSDKELNAFRYADFCFEKFISAARQEKYFENTVFVFVGDHGIAGNAGTMFPRVWTDQNLTNEHVPLLFYAPGKILPAVHFSVSSQLDILPSLASLTGIAYRNNTLGRDLFDTSANDHPGDLRNCAFIFDPNNKNIGLLTDKYYLQRSLVTGKLTAASITGNDPLDNNEDWLRQKDSILNLVNGYYETSRYLLLNNKKKK